MNWGLGRGMKLSQHSLALFGFKTPGRCCHDTCVGHHGALWGSQCRRYPVLGVSGWAMVSSAQILPLPPGPFQVRAGFCQKPAEPAPPAASLGLWLLQALCQILGGDLGQGQSLAPWAHCLCRWSCCHPHAAPATAWAEQWAAVEHKFVASRWWDSSGRQLGSVRGCVGWHQAQ